MAEDNPWDQRYATEDYVYGEQANDFLRDHVASIPAGRVLCLGEGEGRNAVFLAEKGYEVTAVDQSATGLAKCRALAARQGVEVNTVCTNLDGFVIEADAWQGIVSIFCHTPAPIRAALHRQVKDGLRSGGAFLLEAYTPAQLRLKTGGPPVAELMMELDRLREELGTLDFHVAREIERQVVEGRLHFGVGAVVQILARA